jgi:hypothetical protein
MKYRLFPCKEQGFPGETAVKLEMVAKIKF